MELQEYVDTRQDRVMQYACFLLADIADRCAPHDELEDYIEKTRQPSFRQVLFRLIDDKGTGDSDIYKRAGIDRRHFSKIRSNTKYRPGKSTVIALAIALA